MIKHLSNQYLLKAFMLCLVVVLSSVLCSCDFLTGAATKKGGSGGGGSGGNSSGGGSSGNSSSGGDDLVVAPDGDPDWNFVKADRLEKQVNYRLVIPVPEEHDHDHVHDHDHPAEKSKGNEPEEETEDYVTLVSHGSDELRGGLEFKFFVHHAQFFLEVLGPGLTTKKSLRLAQADEGEELPEEIVLYMDVHNNESPAHFVIWSPTFDSSLKADCSNCSNVNALLNSGNLFLFPWNFPEYSESATRGGGLFWGFQATSEMIVKDSGVQDPIVPH